MAWVCGIDDEMDPENPTWLIEDEDIDAQAASIVQHLVETASPETSRATSIAALRRARSEHRASSRRRRYSAPSFSITTAADGMDPSGRSTSMPNARPPSFSVEPTLETPTNGTDLRGWSVPPLPMHRLKGHRQKQVIDLRDLREEIGLIGANKT